MYKTHKNIESLITIKLAILIFLILIYILFLVFKNFIFNPSNYEKKIKISLNNHTILNENKELQININISKYKNMLPHLSPDLCDIIQNKEEIFNARQLYISDFKITSDYIRYIRNINETKKQNYIQNKTIVDTLIDKKLFEKRSDQYDYNTFCKMALNEKLINDDKIVYENKPIISVVVISFNKENILLKSIRSIQNQNFKNMEIIIVNDCSTDKSYKIFKYLLETDPRIRIIHHKSNLGLLRSRIDGILYSKGNYIILFEAGDLYEDNYVLLDAYNIIKKYNLDSCKFLYRVIKSFNDLNNSIIIWHIGNKSKIIYGAKNIEALNKKIAYSCGGIWNRLVKSNIYIKSLLLLNNLTLNLYKNMWDDIPYFS